ncbi:MAG: bifunctional (p)ppGpp synthetase/guanosine-3',5'-bis(diphosphate) 3'-pyrophosphohydrolase [Acidimicrobiales bacterium]|nr:bifunctional (p)ppGpp synthetase/guanosine-3',5'-bis(diphosphate) 3'-pyrophosphohydrolase [Acidimicrobiales bacterium]RZV48712.1 MAG: bifunctional (p)ppGpp synthetase/guanosine-3',5'-bis(diphosphate) 3'-pyrophosphohydrolase [Acidimicrobiales bacterium]
MPTVTRVLPWRRQSSRVESELTAIVEAYRSQDADASIDRIQKAYHVASKSHGDQRRKSGELYISHPLAVAKVVAEFGLDDGAIAAALLHDAVEDTALTLEELSEQFGEDVASVVDGVTKLDRVHFDSKEAQQAASVRKMMVAIAQDVRVLIIKLADRLHNMETIGSLPEFKQQRTASETLEIYAPLAHRLGMQELKQRLEDLAFAAAEPKQYAELEAMVAARAPERDVYIAQLLGDVEGRLRELGINATVTGRQKHLYSIYEKMVVRGHLFENIHDLVGIRVIVDEVRDCYAALGTIHAAWKPVQGRFKDYIAMPKFNLYQSLHTTVIGPLGKEVEVQIRTKEMHGRAEHGVAAHWGYKESAPSGEMAWLSRIMDWEQESSDPTAFMSNLKTDLDQDEVFVFTPKGDVVELPVGATPVDFAYEIHTEVGRQCTGSRVNGKLVPLETRLQSGDRVDIITSKNPDAGPSKDWLKFVATPKAASKIRAHFSRERRSEFIDIGRDELTAALRRSELPVQDTLKSKLLLEVAADMNYTDLEALHAAIGEGHLSPRTIINRITKSFAEEEPAEEPAFLTRVRRRDAAPSSGVHVEGLDDLLVRLATCCTPVPRDDIIGFVTRGRGVSVHRTDCANARSLSASQADRLIEVDWDDRHDGLLEASIQVDALDRPRLLSDVSGVMATNQINVTSVQLRTSADRIAHMTFGFEFGDPAHLEEMLSAVRRIESVYDAYRVLPGSSSDD